MKLEKNLLRRKNLMRENLMKKKNMLRRRNLLRNLSEISEVNDDQREKKNHNVENTVKFQM